MGAHDDSTKRDGLKYLHQRYGLELLKQCRLAYRSRSLAEQIAVVRGNGMQLNAELAYRWLEQNPNKGVQFLVDKFASYMVFLDTEFRSVWMNPNKARPVLFSKGSMDAMTAYGMDLLRHNHSVDRRSAMENMERIMYAQIHTNAAVVAMDHTGWHKNENRNAFAVNREFEKILDAIYRRSAEFDSNGCNRDLTTLQCNMNADVIRINLKYLTRYCHYCYDYSEEMNLDELYQEMIRNRGHYVPYAEAVSLFRRYSGLAPELVVGKTTWLPECDKVCPDSLVERYLITRYIARTCDSDE